MRALLVVNPKATTTTERGRDVLVHALRSEADLTVEYTNHRGHAAELARRAVAEGYDVLVTLGGDGTVNEAVNGLLADGPDPQVPALAVVPGGSTNVFARALGLPRDWTEGTGVILEALQAKRTRTIGLGRVEDASRYTARRPGRYFTFCAGFGLDAEVVRKVERARFRGKTATPALYVRSLFTQFFLETERREPLITMEYGPGVVEDELATVIVQNTAPWTYLGERPINPSPDASFETGLDLMALRELGVGTTARALAQILSKRPNPHGKHVLNLHDLESFTLTSARPLAFQLDGDYLGERDSVIFTAVDNALRVVC
jgi:diacylglycerol kinase family enzyme